MSSTEPSAVVQFAEAMKAMNEPLAAWAEKCRRAFGAMTEAALRSGPAVSGEILGSGPAAGPVNTATCENRQ